MKFHFLFTTMLIPCIGLAQVPPGLAGIPENCQAPLAYDMAMSAIPQLLRIPKTGPHIKKIIPIGNSHAYSIGHEAYRINCRVDVYWDDGAIDRHYLFSVWQDQNGKFQGVYQPPPSPSTRSGRSRASRTRWLSSTDRPSAP